MTPKKKPKEKTKKRNCNECEYYDWEIDLCLYDLYPSPNSRNCPIETGTMRGVKINNKKSYEQRLTAFGKAIEMTQEAVERCERRLTALEKQMQETHNRLISENMKIRDSLTNPDGSSKFESLRAEVESVKERIDHILELHGCETIEEKRTMDKFEEEHEHQPKEARKPR
jgi:hypothetical protein